MSNKQIKKILIALEESVNKDEAKKKQLKEAKENAYIKKVLAEAKASAETFGKKAQLNEGGDVASQLFHVFLDVAELSNHFSHEHHIKHDQVLKYALGTALKDENIIKADWKTTVKLIIKKGIGAIKKAWEIAKVLHKIPDTDKAIAALKSVLGFDLAPKLKLAFANRRQQPQQPQQEA